MNVLILGGTGLISTAITRELLANGVNVTHYNRGQSEERFSGSVTRITGDRRDFATFEAQMRSAPEFDCVIDMICFTPQEAQSDIDAFADRAGHVIFCSTVDVYNRPALRYPITESEGREHPKGDYGRAKARCEEVFFAAHERGDFPVTIIRPAYTYGEGGALIHTFGWSTTYLDRLNKGKPIIVHGDGNGLWSACHIDDAAHAFVRAICSPAAYGKGYHVTAEEWLTWNEYHRLVARALNAPEPKLVHIPTDFLMAVNSARGSLAHINLQYNNIFDNTAARRDLDFSYTIPFLEGARRTIAWLEQHRMIADSDKEPFEDRLINLWEGLATKARLELGAG